MKPEFVNEFMHIIQASLQDQEPIVILYRNPDPEDVIGIVTKLDPEGRRLLITSSEYESWIPLDSIEQMKKLPVLDM